ncbi:DHCR24 [Branchiostoma lanceolatum]|uniref:Delta(24)-sterol reductase n=1 Tax=Branchiostoma lanceolatum TaxID=7740 RepID=A0A8K0E653_BRALA|nr:DHCR24 [Branchiostoma lanceolatum]
MAFIVLGLLASVLLWVCSYQVLCLVNSRCSAEWNCRLVTAAHGVLITCLSYKNGFIDNRWPFTDPGLPNTEYEVQIIMLCLGYFMFDFSWCVYNGTEGIVMLTHHSASIFGLAAAWCVYNGTEGIVMLTRHSASIFGLAAALILGVSGTDVIGVIFGAELTNPFLQLRWFLKETGRYHTLLAEINDFLFISLFTGVRIGVAVMGDSSVFRKRFIRWLEDNRGFIILVFCLPASFLFDTCLQLRNWFRRTFLSAPEKHDERVRDIQRRIRRWNDQPKDKRKPMCTSRPNWLSLSTTFFQKDQCEKIPVDLYNILDLDEERQVVRVEPMVSVGDITRYLIPRGYTLAVTLEIADATCGGLGLGAGMTTYSHRVSHVLLYVYVTHAVTFYDFPGYTLAVTLEIADATCGGLGLGVGMTTYSHRVGFYQEAVESWDVLLGDGSLVHATKDNEHSDLYHALPWSHGSLGLLVAMELKIIPVKPYLKLTYIPVHGQKAYCDMMRDLSGALDKTAKLPDYLEATVFSKEEAVVMVGNFTDVTDPKEKAKINHLASWYKPWFYKHVETFLQKGEDYEYIPLREYLLRHNRAIFWVVESMIPFGNNPLFRLLFGWLLPPKPAFLKFTTTPGVRAMTFAKQDIILPMTVLEKSVDRAEELFDTYPNLFYLSLTVLDLFVYFFVYLQVFQDIVLPMTVLEKSVDRAEELFDTYPNLFYLSLTVLDLFVYFFVYLQVFQDIVLPMTVLEKSVDRAEELFDTYPILIYPCRIYDHGPAMGQLRPPRQDQMCPGTNYGMFYDLGVYGVPGPVKRRERYDPVHAMRSMEKFIREAGGYSFLYADIFMTRDEFEEMFDLTLYEKVRKKYHAEGAFPHLYDKVKPEVDVFAIGKQCAEEFEK